MSGPAKGTAWTADRWDAQRQIASKAKGTLIFKQGATGSSWLGQWVVGGKQVRRKLGDGSLSREQAQERLSDLMADRLPEESPYALYTEREAECIALLRSLAGVVTVRLSRSSFAIFAAQGYGEIMVRRAVHALVVARLAKVRYERSGLDDVPCVRAA